MNTRNTSYIMGFFAIFPWTLIILRFFEFARTSPTAQTLIYVYSAIMILGALISVICYAFCQQRTIKHHLLLGLNCLYAIFALFVFSQLI